MNSVHKKSIFFGVILGVVWLIYAGFFIRQGLDLTDEGLTCSVALRYSLGDLPFRDVYIFHLSDLFTALVLKIFPNCGLIGIRICWAIVLLISILTGFLIISRIFKPSLAFWSMLFSFSIFSCYGTNVPNYNNLPVMFAVVSIALWINALSGTSNWKRIIYSILSGIAAFAAAICKPTFVGMIGIVVISIFFALVIKNKGRQNIWRSAIIFSTTFLVGIGIFFLWLHRFGLVSDFYSCWTALRENLLFSSISRGLVNWGTGDILKASPLVLICLGLAIFVAFWTKGKLIFKICFQIGILLLFTKLLTHTTGIRNRLYFLFAYAYTLIIIGIIVSWPLSNYREEKKKESLVKGTLFLCAAFLQWLSSACSSNGVFGSYHGMILSLPLAVVISYDLLDSLKAKFNLKPAAIHHYQRIVVGFAIIIGIFGIHYKWWHPYRDVIPRSRLNASFQSSKLRGVLSTPEHVEQIDNLLSFISLKVEGGDYILAYQHLPMLYFLTETLPATKITWFMDGGTPPFLVEEALEEMKERGNFPKIVIRTKYYIPGPAPGDWPQKILMNYNTDESNIKGSRMYPINQFVNANYKLIKTVGIFEILAPKDLKKND